MAKQSEGGALELEVGGRWLRWEGEHAPELPDELPAIDAAGQHDLDALEYYHTRAADGSELWGVVGGDGGAQGPYVVAVYCLPGLDDVRPRFPTFEEWAALCAEACLPGAMMSCAFITGSLLIEPPSGRVLILTQTMAMGDTPAGRRWQLAHPGGAPRGGGLIRG